MNMMKTLPCVWAWLCVCGGCWKIRTFVKKGINLWCLSQFNRRDPKALIAPAQAEVCTAVGDVCVCCLSVLFSCHLHFSLCLCLSLPLLCAFIVDVSLLHFLKGNIQWSLRKGEPFCHPLKEGGGGEVWRNGYGGVACVFAWQDVRECKRIYSHTYV